MRTSIICTAILDNDLQIKNLCECIKILGGKPSVSGNMVCVDFCGSKAKADKFIELFEQYTRHGISVIS